MEVGQKNVERLGRRVHESLAVAGRFPVVLSSAKLYSKEQIDRVSAVLGQVHDVFVIERDDVCFHGTNAGQDGAHDAARR